MNLNEIGESYIVYIKGIVVIITFVMLLSIIKQLGLTKLKETFFEFKHDKYYKNKKDKNIKIYVDVSEPNNNNRCDEISKKLRNYNVIFVNSQTNEQLLRVRMNYELYIIPREIESAWRQVIIKQNRISNLDQILENQPERWCELRQEHEHLHHDSREKLSELRKYESFYLKYNINYKRKPLILGEERDNVNTYNN